MRQLIVMQLNHTCSKMDSPMVSLLDFPAVQHTYASTMLAALLLSAQGSHAFLSVSSVRVAIFLHCTLAAAQCIVIGPVCLWVCLFVCLWVCYHDNLKLHVSILTKLGL